jgi:hypothetical protein
MDLNIIMTLVGSLGFPIVACIGLGWYVKYMTDTNRSDMTELRKEHKDEMTKMTEALNNNTLVIQKLIDKLDKEE